MKKALSLVFLFTFIALCFTGAVFAKSDIHITVDGKELYSDQPPIIKNDRVFVPVRVIAESLGANVEYSNMTGDAVVSISDDSHTSEFIIDYAFCLIDGLELAMDTAPFIENSRTLLPVRIVSEALGCSVSWDGDTRTVSVQKSGYDESGYSKLKIYPDKPLVYEAICEEEPYYFSPHHIKYCKYSVPSLNINEKGAKALSKEINKLYEKYKGDSKDLLYEMRFSYYLYDGILSVVIYSDWDIGESYDVFCYDTESKRTLENEEIFSRYGIDKGQLENTVMNKCRLNFEVSGAGQSRSLSDITVNSVFIDNNGYIRAVVNSYEYGGEFTVDSEMIVK